MKRVFLFILSIMLTAGIASAQDIVPERSIPRFRLSVQGGMGIRTAKVDDSIQGDTRDYVKKLKTGKIIGADLAYFLSQGYGFGIKYSNFLSSNKIYGQITFDDGTKESGYLSDNIGVTFIGPFMTLATAVTGSSNVLMLNAGLGYLGFKDDGYAASRHTVTTGASAGVYLGFCYDYRISNTLAIGAELSAISGSLTKIGVNKDGVFSSESLENPESLNHVSASIGIRIYL